MDFYQKPSTFVRMREITNESNLNWNFMGTLIPFVLYVSFILKWQTEEPQPAKWRRVIQRQIQNLIKKSYFLAVWKAAGAYLIVFVY